MVALTGGGPYALACAAAIPERLTGVAIVSGAAPLERVGADALGAMGPLIGLARRSPRLPRTLYGVLVPLMRRWPERAHHLVSASYSEAERRVAERSEVRQTQIAMILEVFRSGARGEVTEVAPLGAPWGFRPEDITMAVHLWDGDQNRLIPPTHAQYLARALPQSQLTVCPGEGHLLIVDHMDEILRTALGGAPRPGAERESSNSRG